MAEITKTYTIEGNVIRCGEFMDERLTADNQYELFVLIDSNEKVIIDMTSSHYVDVCWLRFLVVLSMEGNVVWRGINPVNMKTLQFLGWDVYCKFES